MLPPGSTLISYRRVSDLLVDLSNTGIISSSTTSEGRNGYTSKFMLNMNPETVGKMIDEKKWEMVVMEKEKEDVMNLFSKSDLARGKLFGEMLEKK